LYQNSSENLRFVDTVLYFPQNNPFVESKETAMAKVVAFSGTKMTAPDNVLRKVPTRPKNLEVRSREHLLPDEVDALMKAASGVGRHRLRDRALILLAYRHGLRVSELVGLKWDQFDLKRGQVHINRLKNGSAATHPIEGDELRLLKRVKREYPDTPFLFTTERGGPLTRSTVSKLISRAGQKAELAFPVHPHMLRHGTGYYLANKGVPTRTIQAYLGHRSIQHTVRYTELSAKAFKNLWC
jgi:type 1 fimbriae regulatory protein FimB/type 1 fimbriae regulatory protein FimE